MKKILFLLLAAGFFMVSCEKEKVGNTATVKMSGEWLVTVDLANDDGSVAVEDCYGLGQVPIATYNTEKNVPTEMWIDDLGNFWDFKVNVDLDYNAATFSTKDFVDNYSYESQVKISNGKVLFDAAKTPSGMPADSIVFYVSFDDDDPGTIYKMSGYRYTGFANDEP